MPHARELLKAFEVAKQRSMARALEVSTPRFPIPWCYAYAQRAQQMFGADYWPYGIDANRKTLEAFQQYAHEQGVCHRHLAPEELFAPEPPARSGSDPCRVATARWHYGLALHTRILDTGGRSGNDSEDPIMALTGPELVHTWFREVWDKGRAEAIDDFAAADWVGHGVELPGGPELSGRERFRLLHQAYQSAFPDVTITVDRTMHDGDHVAAQCTVRATHTGDGLGFAATGRPVSFTGVLIVRCKDGKIVESWESWNFLSMYQQLGRTLT